MPHFFLNHKFQQNQKNAIAGMKRFNILVHDFRNHRPLMDDDVIAICAGLWNFLLS